MSYDLILFRPPAGRDPLVIAQARFASDEGESYLVPPDPTWPTMRLAAAAALQRAHPHLIAFGDPPTELYSREEDGVRIGLYDSTASVCVAFWHSGRRAIEVWWQAWSYLRILVSVGELTIFDPQRETIVDLDLDLDFAAVLDAYASGLSKLLRVANRPASPHALLNARYDRRGNRGKRRRRL